MTRRSRPFAAVVGAALVSAAVVGCSERPPAAPPMKRQAFGAVSKARLSSPLLKAAAPNTAVLAVDAGLAGDRISGLLEVPLDQCAIIIARAGASVEDVDLFAYGEDGSVVGSDEGPDKTPALLVCPPHPSRMWVAARIASGHGLVAVGAERVPPPQANRVATMYGIRPVPSDVGEVPASWPGLDEGLAAHRREIGGTWQDIRRVALPLDARTPTRLSTSVEAGRCVDVFVTPSDEVGHVELIVEDTNGAIIGRAESGGRERFVLICSPLDTNVAIELRPQSGRGVGVLSLSRTRPGSESELEADRVRIDAFPDRDLDAALSAVESELDDKNGYPAGKRVASGLLELGRRSSSALVLAAGCSRLDVLGGRPLRGLAGSLWSPSAQLVAQAEAGARLTLFACGNGGSYRLDLEATLRPGPFAVLVHNDGDVPPALIANPLAAARLLGHVVEHGVLRRPAEIGQVTELALSDSELKTIDFTVPFGRCVDVALGLDKDAVGAEVRLVSQSSGAEIAIARGAHAASARACGLDAASAQSNLKSRAELRVAAGSGKGLVATRMLTPTR